MAFSPDGKTLAASVDGTVRLWDVATGKGMPPPRGLSGRSHVSFSPDGKTLASGSDDDTVRLADVATGRQIGSPLTGHTGDVSKSAVFSPDGKTLASGGYQGTVQLWMCPQKTEGRILQYRLIRVVKLCILFVAILFAGILWNRSRQGAG